MLRPPSAGTAAPALPPTRQIGGALQAYPGRAKTLTVPADERHNAQADIARPDGSTLQVFVDPATGKVAGAIDESERNMTLVKHIHSLTVAGTAGQAEVGGRQVDADTEARMTSDWAAVIVSGRPRAWLHQNVSGESEVSMRGSADWAAMPSLVKLT